MATRTQATVEDLIGIPENGKAEIVHGELVRMSPTGAKPGRAAGKIFASLNNYEELQGGGYAFADNVGFIVNLPNRVSFSPDAAWYIGVLPDGMKFAQGAPAFAVEVRSEGDYGPQADRAITAKIQDYFTAGTRVVWDVDLLSDNVITSYSANNSQEPLVFRRGDFAHAEPAVPGWTVPVDVHFR